MMRTQEELKVNEDGNLYFIGEDDRKYYVASTHGMPFGYGHHKSNAEFLCKAWNEYDGLVAEKAVNKAIIAELMELVKSSNLAHKHDHEYYHINRPAKKK
jgi:hypothetical protein